VTIGGQLTETGRRSRVSRSLSSLADRLSKPVSKAVSQKIRQPPPLAHPVLRNGQRHAMNPESTIHLLHREAAKQHSLAAQSHRTASEHNEKGDNPTGNWHNQRAREYSNRAYELAKEAHDRSGQVGSH
jgi:hypothetical protein